MDHAVQYRSFAHSRHTPWKLSHVTMGMVLLGPWHDQSGQDEGTDCSGSIIIDWPLPVHRQAWILICFNGAVEKKYQKKKQSAGAYEYRHHLHEAKCGSYK